MSAVNTPRALWFRVSAFACAALIGGACRSPATQVELILDSDAPADRRFDLRVIAVKGSISPTDLQQTMTQRALMDLTLVRTNGALTAPEEPLTLPGSFTIVPASTGSTEPVTVWIRGRVAATQNAPEILLDRVVQLSFVRGAHAHARVYLPLRCGDRATGCTSVNENTCTVSVRCREQGATCGDLGECIAPALPVIVEQPNDASEDAQAVRTDVSSGRVDVPTMDVQSMDVQSPDAAIEAGDAGDAGDASDAGMDARMDVPTDMARDVTMDARDALTDARTDVNDADVTRDVPTDIPTDIATDAGVDPLVVTNTTAMGLGSLSNAINYLNGHCNAGDPKTITFNIPRADSGFVLVGGQRVWRITTVPVATIACAGAFIDGFTQTMRQGDTNAVTFGRRNVGAAAVALPIIQGPEIELRAVELSVTAANVRIRGLALRGLAATSANNLIVEQCMFDSEPNALTPLPMGERASTNIIFSAQTSANMIIRENVFVWQIGVSNMYNGIHIITNSTGPIIRDNYMTGVGGGGVWDEIHLNPALNPLVIHNYIGGTGWEKHIEWVMGVSGDVSQNTFAMGPTMVTMPNGPITLVGNLTE